MTAQPWEVDEWGKRVPTGDPQPTIRVVPLTLPKANGLVARLHRHHAPIPGGFGWFCVGAVADGLLIGCAIAGRPTNRNNDDGQTVEVLRVATDGTPNAPSCLLAACAKAARAVGARRVITYTLDSEGGASLRGAGWVREADGIESWWTHPGKDGAGRTPAVDRPHMAEHKVRWGVTFRELVDYETAATEPRAGEGPDLLGLLEDVEPLHVVPGNSPAVDLNRAARQVGDGSLNAVDLDHPSQHHAEQVDGIGLVPGHIHNPHPTEARP